MYFLIRFPAADVAETKGPHTPCVRPSQDTASRTGQENGKRPCHLGILYNFICFHTRSGSLRSLLQEGRTAGSSPSIVPRCLLASGDPSSASPCLQGCSHGEGGSGPAAHISYLLLRKSEGSRQTPGCGAGPPGSEGRVGGAAGRGQGPRWPAQQHLPAGLSYPHRTALLLSPQALPSAHFRHAGPFHTATVLNAPLPDTLKKPLLLSALHELHQLLGILEACWRHGGEPVGRQEEETINTECAPTSPTHRLPQVDGLSPRGTPWPPPPVTGRHGALAPSRVCSGVPSSLARGCHSQWSAGWARARGAAWDKLSPLGAWGGLVTAVPPCNLLVRVKPGGRVQTQLRA